MVAAGHEEGGLVPVQFERRGLQDPGLLIRDGLAACKGQGGKVVGTVPSEGQIFPFEQGWQRGHCFHIPCVVREPEACIG